MSQTTIAQSQTINLQKRIWDTFDKSISALKNEMFDLTKQENLQPGDIEKIKFAFLKWKNPDIQNVLNQQKVIDDNGNSLLYWAVVYGHAEVVKFLIDQGEDIHEYHNTENISLLHVASMCGRTEIAEILLDHGASLYYRDEMYGHAPIIPAIVNGYVETVGMMLDRILLDVRTQEPLPPTLLQGAFRPKSSLPILQLTDVKRNNYLHYAMIAKSDEMACLFIEAGVNPFLQNREGNTPFHLRCNKRMLDCLKENWTKHAATRILVIENKAGQTPFQCLRSEREGTIARAPRLAEQVVEDVYAPVIRALDALRA